VLDERAEVDAALARVDADLRHLRRLRERDAPGRLEARPMATTCIDLRRLTRSRSCAPERPASERPASGRTA
jgi:hypothetical protein